MNLILLFDDDFIAGRTRVRITGRRHEHIRRIHRITPGGELIVGLCNGPAGTGTVTRIDDEVLEMDVRLTGSPPPPLDVTLVLALPRPPALKRVLSAVTAMGVKRIFLINSRRVEKSFWKSRCLEADALKEQMVLGLEQARDTVLPEVTLRPLFKPFLEDELPQIIRGTVPLVAHPESEQACPRRVAGAVTLAVGPEGGFIPYEIEKLKSLGFAAVTLGERVLRVETAVPALLARLS